VEESTPADDLPADIETAWAKWSAGIQKVDERGMELLRAAFEAGCATGNRSAAAECGGRGGLKGGKARAEKLSAEKRSRIAKDAAHSRWKKC
jgi:hypothetical protein